MIPWTVVIYKDIKFFLYILEIQKRIKIKGSLLYLMEKSMELFGHVS